MNAFIEPRNGLRGALRKAKRAEDEVQMVGGPRLSLEAPGGALGSSQMRQDWLALGALSKCHAARPGFTAGLEKITTFGVGRC